MSLTKRNRVWHYDFIYKGRRFQGSTGQTNINKAKLVEAKVRSDAALEAFGIGAPKVSPLFRDFMADDGAFLTFVRRHSKKKRTIEFYKERTARLLEYAPWSEARLSDIDEEALVKYCEFRIKSVKVSTVNREIATIRKALYLAYEWKLIPRKPRVRQLPGEVGRTFVLTADFEREYLAAATYPLKEAAILILDLGLRPDECVSLRKSDISGDALLVREGKTANARRSLPLTARCREVIRLCSALFPDSEFLFPGNKGGHLRRMTLDNYHTRLRRKHSHWPAEFVLYSLRHTFGTRLAESGASPFDILQLMGHSNIAISQRYVHQGAGHLTLSMKRKEAMDRLLRGEVQEDTSVKERS